MIAAYLACALIWGTTWYAIRVCIAGYPTLASVALRFLFAAVVLAPLALRAQPWPRGRTWGWLVLAGLCNATGYALVYLGEERVSGAVAAVLYLYFYLLDKTSLLVTSTLVFVFPLVALLTDALFERALPLTARAYLGAAITLGGLAVSLRRP